MKQPTGVRYGDAPRSHTLVSLYVALLLLSHTRTTMVSESMRGNVELVGGVQLLRIIDKPCSELQWEAVEVETAALMRRWFNSGGDTPGERPPIMD